MRCRAQGARRARHALLVAMALALAGAACGSTGSSGGGPPDTGASSPDQAAPTAPPPVEGTALTIKGFSFEPAELRAKVGDTVTVTNVDGTDHSVTAIDGSFDTGRFKSGARTFKVSSAGRFEFRCEVHGFMPHGFIQVSG